MPYPHKELIFAREMNLRGDKMMVMTPDLVDFCNDLKGFTSRNSMISVTKKMLFMRGVRTNIELGRGGDNKDYYLRVACCKAKKASAIRRNFSIKKECPFALYFERKSCLLDPTAPGRSAKEHGFRTHQVADPGFKALPLSPGEEEKEKEVKIEIMEEVNPEDLVEQLKEWNNTHELEYEDNIWGYGPWRDVNRYKI
jgi:hypothetical protein